jgi:hypothetical protein
MRGFDFEVILNSGLSTIFSGADKRELEIVTGYFTKAEVEVKTINEMANIKDDLGSSGDDENGSIATEDIGEDGDGEEEDDDDFVAPDEDKGDDDWGSDDDAVDEDK